jgi:hypothetical protein
MLSQYIAVFGWNYQVKESWLVAGRQDKVCSHQADESASIRTKTRFGGGR